MKKKRVNLFNPILVGMILFSYALSMILPASAQPLYSEDISLAAADPEDLPKGLSAEEWR